jgi:hypothetical protein
MSKDQDSALHLDRCSEFLPIRTVNCCVTSGKWCYSLGLYLLFSKVRRQGKMTSRGLSYRDPGQPREAESEQDQTPEHSAI